MISAGSLRHVIAMQRPNETELGTGETSTAWVTYADELPANIEPVTANERTRIDGTIAHEVTHKVTLRYLDPADVGYRVDSNHRVLLTIGESPYRAFQIKGVIDVGERGRVHQLLCTETVGVEIEDA